MAGGTARLERYALIASNDWRRTANRFNSYSHFKGK
jgi:hypothetical protein